MTDDLKIDRPISGDISRTHHNTAVQYTPAEFLAEIDRALETPGVRGLVWEQYTPYFNDGEPCEFSVREVRALLEDDNGEHDDELEYGEGWSSYDVYDYRNNGASPWSGELDKVDWKTLPGGADGRTIYELLHTFKTASWEDVAQTNFGDHAQVTATADGFSVEYYDHE